MKYTVEKTSNWLESDYVIRKNLRQELSWQGAGMACLAIWLVMLLGFVGVGVFVSAKVFMFIWTLPVMIGCTGLIFSVATEANGKKFKLLPRKVDKWDYSMRVESQEGRETAALLKRALEYKELASFVNPDELVEEVILALRLRASGKITRKELSDYDSTLLALMDECEKRKYKELLGARESHNSTVKSALEVAQAVNKELL